MQVNHVDHVTKKMYRVERVEKEIFAVTVLVTMATWYNEHNSVMIIHEVYTIKCCLFFKILRNYVIFLSL